MPISIFFQPKALIAKTAIDTLHKQNASLIFLLLVFSHKTPLKAILFAFLVKRELKKVAFNLKFCEYQVI
ncbi:hypothetical protein NXX61_00815 [Bacteroides ovatus]|nr:hypothetical protein [Bacteroides ovatus]